MQWWGNRPLFSQHLEWLGSGNQGAISLHVQGLTCQCRLYREPHRGKDQGVQNLKFFHQIPPPWNLLHIAAGSYWCYQLINSGGLFIARGCQCHHSFTRCQVFPETVKATGSAFCSRRAELGFWVDLSTAGFRKQWMLSACWESRGCADPAIYFRGNSSNY